MPMKLIFYVIHDVNASFAGDIGVKVWKCAYFLEKSFYWVSIICQVLSNSFI